MCAQKRTVRSKGESERSRGREKRERGRDGRKKKMRERKERASADKRATKHLEYEIRKREINKGKK